MAETKKRGVLGKVAGVGLALSMLTVATFSPIASADTSAGPQGHNIDMNGYCITSTGSQMLIRDYLNAQSSVSPNQGLTQVPQQPQQQYQQSQQSQQSTQQFQRPQYQQQYQQPQQQQQYQQPQQGQGQGAGGQYVVPDTISPVVPQGGNNSGSTYNEDETNPQPAQGFIGQQQVQQQQPQQQQVQQRVIQPQQQQRVVQQNQYQTTQQQVQQRGSIPYCSTVAAIVNPSGSNYQNLPQTSGFIPAFGTMLGSAFAGLAALFGLGRMRKM